jgi:predicted transcriptional regulator
VNLKKHAKIIKAYVEGKKELSDGINKLLESEGIRQRSIADRVGWSTSYVSYLLGKKGYASYEQLVHLAEEIEKLIQD